MRTLIEMESNLPILTKEEVEIYGYSKLFKDGEMAMWIMDNWSYPALNNFIQQNIIYEFYNKRGCYILQQPVWLSDNTQVAVYGRLFSVCHLKKDYERKEFQVILEDIDDGDNNYVFNIEHEGLYAEFKSIMFSNIILDTEKFKNLVIANKDKLI